MVENVLQMSDISKSFKGVHALKRVTFNARAGKVNVLMGENGAGKSTLMRILVGAHKKDSGEICIGGKKVSIESPRDAIDHHIAMIYQELNLIMDMTVEENIFIGREITKSIFLDKKALLSKTRQLMEEYGVNIDPKAVVSQLSVANQQMLEIVKALSLDARIIIMDEPTSSLTAPEVRILFKIIKKLNEQGITIIYISHRMEEVFEIGDYITIMRDGELAGEWSLKEIKPEEVICAMVGRKILKPFAKEKTELGKTVLKVERLSKKGVFENINFELRKGEILGVSGLVGAGRTEMAMGIFGALPITDGSVYLNGKEITIRNPGDAIRHKIAYVPEDRKVLGLDLNTRICNNISLTNMDIVAPKGFLDHRKEREISKNMVEKLKIKTPSVFQEAGNLSGGNQQKVVLAKWLSRELDVLILDEPTRGVDIGAKEEIHKLISKLAGEGLGIILISSEMTEVLGMSDRVLVMHEGQQKVILDASQATQEKVMSYAV
ncbi:sugar ABC transporter ATP-binding protein [uncultured Robinsoniella sp.]|uniref:sugar ABC transporter ATP-binding protein n=1 Tax=uncultured Robinsoniella sp. TaxID=904190 RepID=UPI00374FACE6